MSNNEIPSGDAQDNSYVNRTGQQQYGIPVTKDDAPVAPNETEEVDATADSDDQLVKPSPYLFSCA